MSPPSDAPPRAWPIGNVRAWSVVLVATLTMCVSYIDRQTLAALAPAVMDALSISHVGYGWLLAAFSWAYLFGAPIAGRWIDGAGARRGLVLAMLLWSAVAATHAIVPGFAALFALRIALGIAESPGFPGAAQTIQRVLPPSQRSAGLGLVFTGSSVGAVVAPPLAYAFVQHFGWRAAFVGTAIAGLAWVPLWLAATSSRSVRTLLDETRSAVGEGPFRSTVVVSERRAVDLAHVARHPAVLRAVCVVLATAPLIAFNLLWLPRYLVDSFHLPMLSLARFLVVPPIVFDLGAISFGALASVADRSPRHEALRNALFALATAFCLSAIAAPFAHDPWTCTLLLGAGGFGGGATYTLITSDMLSRVPQGAVSSAGGMTAAAQSLAYIIANPIVGATVEHTHRYVGVIVALGLLVVPGALVWLLWRPPPRV